MSNHAVVGGASHSELAHVVASSIAAGQVDVTPIVSLAPHSRGDLRTSQDFYLSVKPELLDLRGGVRVAQAVRCLLDQLSAHGCEVTGMVLLPSDSIEAKAMVRAQYFILACVAYDGVEGLPIGIDKSLTTSCSDRFPGALPVGAVDAVRRLGMRDLATLQLAWDLRGGLKLGPGQYGCVFDDEPPALLVLNGFYPMQEAWLTQPRGYALGMAVRGDMSLRRFREEVVGNIQPAAARHGSIRRALHERREELRLPAVSIERNCVHVAPNAFDTMLGLATLHSLCGSSSGLGCTAFWSYVEERNRGLLGALRSYASQGKRPTRLQYHLHTATEDLEYADCLQALHEFVDLPT